MVLAAGGIYGVAASPAFGFGNLQVEGVRFTREASLHEVLDVPPGSNLFSLSTGALRTKVLALTTVERVRIAVALPNTLVIEIEEREPVLAWKVGRQSFLVDPGGRLFADLGTDRPPEARALRVMEDSRRASRALGLGDILKPVDLEAARLLGSVVPADVGSSASTLQLSVTDEHGFVLGTGPNGWTAVFGFYTPTLRTTDLIAGQVRLLRSLLADREGQVQRVILASETDGTYVPRPSPTPAESPGP
jgi:hypothetical protein